MSDFKDNGWIAIHRRILENPIMSKPNYIAVWLYILLKCNHASKKLIVNNEPVILKRGEFLGSLQGISKHFGISISNAKKIVDYFERDKMLNTKRTRNYTIFQVVNYSQYQNDEHPENTKRTPRETNNNDNNDNNDNNTPYIPQGDFNALWSSWIPFEMVKGDKQKAREAYAKALNQVQPDEIAKQAKDYCDNCHRLKSKTKHIVTWLNERSRNGWACDAVESEIMIKFKTGKLGREDLYKHFDRDQIDWYKREFDRSIFGG